MWTRRKVKGIGNKGILPKLTLMYLVQRMLNYSYEMRSLGTETNFHLIIFR